ncbi:MAG: erythromycin esterase family protein, partial [Nitrosospira sp.]
MSDLNSDNKLIDALERQAQPIMGRDNDYDSIIQAVQGNTSVNDKAKIVVLIGEATYGTAEFYRIRSEITQRLITEQGFDAIAIEAD